MTLTEKKGENEFTANWGIVSTGLISEDFAKAITSWKSNHHRIAAVSARNLEDAKEFAEKFQIPAYYDSYEKLFADKDVNVVYIGSVNQTHRDLCLKAIDSGKHVLCEKPMAINRAEQEDVLKAAEKKNIFFMEGIWTRFFPVVKMVKQDIKNNEIGELKYMISNMMIPNKEMVRVRSKEYGGGSILDLGIYPIQMACLMFDHEKPIKITASGHLMHSGVDECVSITLLYPNQRIAQLNISSNCHLFAPSFFIGDKGVIRIPELSECPTSYIKANGEKIEEPLVKIGETNFPNTAGLCFEAEEMRLSIQKGLTQHPLVTHDQSRLILSIMEEAKNQIGYKS